MPAELLLERKGTSAVRAMPRRGAPKSEKSLTAQINVRLDAKLKEAGDEALALAGFSPSEAVRALWAKAARGGDDLQELVSCLRPSEPEVDAEKERRLRLIDGMSHIVSDVVAQYGLPPIDYSKVRPLTEEELERQMYEDYLAEGLIR